jgi:hypothetical protein
LNHTSSARPAPRPGLADTVESAHGHAAAASEDGHAAGDGAPASLATVVLAPLQGDCVVCHESAASGSPGAVGRGGTGAASVRRGPLAWLAHAHVCGTMASALATAMPPEAYHDSTITPLPPCGTSLASPWPSTLRYAVWGATYSDIDWRPGLHVSTCGHMVHEQCFQEYRLGPMVGHPLGATGITGPAFALHALQLWLLATILGRVQLASITSGLLAA